MDSPSPASSVNIVAVAMSSANLATVSPDSPQPVTVPTSSEVSPQHKQTPHFPVIGSPIPHARSPTKMPSSESMEIAEHRSRTITKQHSQESDTVTQQSMDSLQTVSSPHCRSEDDKTGLMQSDLKDHRLVGVTHTSPFPSTSVNGDSRISQHRLLYNSSVEKQMMNPLPLSLPYLPKMEEQDTDRLPRAKEDTTYPITCGSNKADLVWRKFICPGINAKCVKCGESWFTPKEFVNFAGKSTLKDWKRAIRINGIMLRKMIENGDLNYYDHDNNCSNQCRSNKSSSFDNSCEKPYNSFESETREMSREASFDGGLPLRSSSEDHAFSARKTALTNALNKSLESASGNSLERSSSEDSGLAATSPHLEGVLMREAPIAVDKIQDLLGFWNGIIKMDLFDDIVRDVLTQITNLHSKTKQAGSISAEDVGTMTNIVNSLEMIPSIVTKMSLHKHKVEKETEESSHAIQELERKLAEQKKYEQDLKRKSQHLDNVMLLTPTEKRQKRNIIRIGRQKAIDSRIPPGVIPGTSTSSGAANLRENPLLATNGRICQREFWSSAMQVDGMARAKFSQSSSVRFCPACNPQNKDQLLPPSGENVLCAIQRNTDPIGVKSMSTSMFSKAASSQMARMNVSGSSAQAAMSAGISPYSMFTHTSLHHTAPEVYASSALHAAFVPSQVAAHQSRESAHSPKK